MLLSLLKSIFAVIPLYWYDCYLVFFLVWLSRRKKQLSYDRKTHIIYADKHIFDFSPGTYIFPDQAPFFLVLKHAILCQYLFLWFESYKFLSLNVHQLYELEFICIVLLFKTHYEFQFSRNPVFFASRNQFQGRIKPKVCADQFQVRIKPKVCADFLHFYQLFAGSVLLFSRKSSVTCYFVASFTKSHRFGTSPPFFPTKGREHADLLAPLPDH